MRGVGRVVMSEGRQPMTSGVVPHQLLAGADRHDPPAGPAATAGLLERCGDGEDAAWRELVRRYERLIFSVALRQGLTLEDAADVTQTVFEALFLSLPRLRHEEKVAPWLVSVTQRQAWRVRQRQLREAPPSGLVVDVGDGAGELPGATSIAGGSSADLELTVWLYEGVQELPDPCRSLLLALYFDPSEPSYAEVAVRLRRPVGSIGPTRARCLEHLRRVLGELGGCW